MGSINQETFEKKVDTYRDVFEAVAEGRAWIAPELLEPGARPAHFYEQVKISDTQPEGTVALDPASFVRKLNSGNPTGTFPVREDGRVFTDAPVVGSQVQFWSGNPSAILDTTAEVPTISATWGADAHSVEIDPEAVKAYNEATIGMYPMKHRDTLDRDTFAGSGTPGKIGEVMRRETHAAAPRW